MKAVVSWFRRSFNLLDSKRSRWQLVIFCGIFGCLFLNVFKPFNMSEWFRDTDTPLFFILTFFSAAGMAALALTQFALRSLFRIRLTTRIGFFTWLLLEFFLISVAVHLVNHVVTGHSLLDFAEYFETLKYTLMVLVIPYFLAILILYVQAQVDEMKELTLKINRTATTENVTISDENGKVVFNIASRNILYFKSEDNYILLFHKVDNQVKKELIRTNLKKLEQELDLPNFIRIHRSYMINSHNLASASRTPRGYQVRMETTAEVLPVSITYQQKFEDRVVQN